MKKSRPAGGWPRVIGESIQLFSWTQQIASSAMKGRIWFTNLVAAMLLRNSLVTLDPEYPQARLNCWYVPKMNVGNDQLEGAHHTSRLPSWQRNSWRRGGGRLFLILGCKAHSYRHPEDFLSAVRQRSCRLGQPAKEFGCPHLLQNFGSWYRYLPSWVLLPNRKEKALDTGASSSKLACQLCPGGAQLLAFAPKHKGNEAGSDMQWGIRHASSSWSIICQASFFVSSYITWIIFWWILSY